MPSKPHSDHTYARAKISLIIPVLNDEAALQTLLRHVAEFDLFEIIIADGKAVPPNPSSSGPPPLALATQAKLQHINCVAGRGGQIATAIASARGDYIWVLHADCVPDIDSVAAMHQILANSQVALGCFSLRFNHQYWGERHWGLKLFAICARFDSLLTSFGDQGFFFRRSDYTDLDLNLQAFPLLEDIALRRALKRKGRVKKSRLPIITSARRFERDGILRTQWRNGVLLTRYALGASPSSLYELYYGL